MNLEPCLGNRRQKLEMVVIYKKERLCLKNQKKICHQVHTIHRERDRMRKSMVVYKVAICFEIPFISEAENGRLGKNKYGMTDK